MARGGPGGALEGGGPPPGGGPEGGGPPPGGVKKGQKVANQGGPLGAPLFPLENPYLNWGWLAKKRARGGPPGGGTPPHRGGPGGAPPLRGGDFGASRPGQGGVPPLGGGPQGGVPRGGPQGAEYGKKRAKNGHFIGVLSKFRPKI